MVTCWGARVGLEVFTGGRQGVMCKTPTTISRIVRGLCKKLGFLETAFIFVLNVPREKC